MKTQLILTPECIDEPALIAERAASDGMGAAVVFHGVVRAQEGDTTISAIEYESFDDMACVLNGKFQSDKNIFVYSM